MQNGIYVGKDISFSVYLHNEKVFVINLSILIIHQDLSFGGIASKIEFVVFVDKLINYEIIFLLLGYVITSTNDLQPSSAIANESLIKSVSPNWTITLELHTFKAHYNILLTDYLINWLIQ